MIKVNEVAFIGYPVNDMKRARGFYEGILGLVPDEGYGKSDDEKFMEYTFGGSTISLGAMDSWKPSKDGPCAGLEVENMEDTLSTLKEKNIEFVMEAQEFPSCSMAIVRDPDGNQIVIHKRK